MFFLGDKIYVKEDKEEETLIEKFDNQSSIREKERQNKENQKKEHEKKLRLEKESLEKDEKENVEQLRKLFRTCSDGVIIRDYCVNK